ncbi:TetR/AcrR family transcriptional regulator [Kordiimonas aquimaris]|uniref:TetR/AcrR family transcriptional regulator n=1 Tax=Kordiimonas aquimaris TaxID=707591 RepID=UPI0021D13903|nr:TetR/AcrR family transcriptional regulator [Kordiimonas aquimaris]
MNGNELLSKAMDVFIRYGFRKTSMEDVARAVGMSRQAIYNRFKNKKALFKAVVDAMMHESFDAARAAIEEDGKSIHARLLNAFDCAAGQHVDALRSSPHSYEVIAMVNVEGADEVELMQRQFNADIAEVLVSEGLFEDNKQAQDAMFAMFVASKGLLYSAENRQAFSDGLERVIRALLLNNATKT